MAIDVTQNLAKKFSFKNTRTLMEFLNTYNMASQAVAVSGTVGIQTTGGAAAIINGQYENIESDDILISATSTTETDWATATAYVAGDIRQDSVTSERFLCILAHTSGVVNRPRGAGADAWQIYWEARPMGGVRGDNTTITTAFDQYFTILAMADGVLTLYQAGDEGATGLAVFKMPMFDPKTYVCVGHLLVANASGSDFEVGVTSFATGSVTETWINQIGPIFPHPDNWDKN